MMSSNSRNNQLARCGAVAALLALVSVTGCRNAEADYNPDTPAMSAVSQGVAGTGVGARGVETHGDPPTGSSTQRTGTGYTGPVGVPGPGQAGR